MAPYTYKNANNLKNCLFDLKKHGVLISQYIPYYSKKDCSDKLFCEQVKSELTEIYETELFSDISFDYTYLNLIKELGFEKKFTLNIWGIPFDQENQIKSFRNIIFPTNDINNY